VIENIYAESVDHTMMQPLEWTQCRLNAQAVATADLIRSAKNAMILLWDCYARFLHSRKNVLTSKKKLCEKLRNAYNVSAARFHDSSSYDEKEFKEVELNAIAYLTALQKLL